MCFLWNVLTLVISELTMPCDPYYCKTCVLNFKVLLIGIFLSA